MTHQHNIVVVGLGNTLVCDEGAGTAVIEALSEQDIAADLIDGGTIGLRLLPIIEGRSGVIFVDVAKLNEAPGTVKTFAEVEFNAFMTRTSPSAHDVGLHDMVTAMRLAETLPPLCALVAIQPEKIEMGHALSPSVTDAIPVACKSVRALVADWRGKLVAD